MKWSEEITKNTLVDYPRLTKLREFLDMTKHLPGNNAEVGVYKGGTAYLIAEHSKKPLYVFDTFEGMPQVNKKYDLHNTGDFKDTTHEHVKNLLSPFGHAEVYKGTFPQEKSDKIFLKTFSFVHLDCDIYDSVKDSLEFFYKRMEVGGIIAFDDYAFWGTPGAKVAVDEFLIDKKEKIFSICQCQAAIIKE